MNHVICPGCDFKLYLPFLHDLESLLSSSVIFYDRKMEHRRHFGCGGVFSWFILLFLNFFLIAALDNINGCHWFYLGCTVKFAQLKWSKRLLTERSWWILGEITMKKTGKIRLRVEQTVSINQLWVFSCKAPVHWQRCRKYPERLQRNSSVKDFWETFWYNVTSYIL